MVEGYAREKMILIRGLGGEIVLVPHEAGIQGAVAKANELAASIPGAVPMRQFENPANPRIHYETTGPEIWEQMDGKVDGIAFGVGTGGTFCGVARFLKEKDPADRLLGRRAARLDLRRDATGRASTWWRESGTTGSRPRSTARSPTASSPSPTPRATRWSTASAGWAFPRRPRPAPPSPGRNGSRGMLGEGKRVVTLLSDPSERYFSKYVYDGLYEGRRIP